MLRMITIGCLSLCIPLVAWAGGSGGPSSAFTVTYSNSDLWRLCGTLPYNDCIGTLVIGYSENDGNEHCDEADLLVDPQDVHVEYNVNLGEQVDNVGHTFHNVPAGVSFCFWAVLDEEEESPPPDYTGEGPRQWYDYIDKYSWFTVAPLTWTGTESKTVGIIVNTAIL